MCLLPCSGLRAYTCSTQHKSYRMKVKGCVALMAIVPARTQMKPCVPLGQCVGCPCDVIVVWNMSNCSLAAGRAGLGHVWDQVHCAVCHTLVAMGLTAQPLCVCVCVCVRASHVAGGWPLCPAVPCPGLIGEAAGPGLQACGGRAGTSSADSACLCGNALLCE